MRFNMAILDEFLYNEGKPGTALTDWWIELSVFMASGKVLGSVSTRYTIEQVASQTCGKLRFPYVPFLGLHFGPTRRSPRHRREVLLFHNNLQPLLVFKMGLKMAMESMGETDLLQMFDMNAMSTGLCRREM